MSQTRDMPSLASVLELYETARFGDAWEITSHLWSQPEMVARLDLEELVFAGRLAERLGGQKIRRALHREAVNRDPTSPLVRYYCVPGTSRRRTLFDELREFENDPRLDSGDDQLDASWYAGHAVQYAYVRDFDTAERWIEEALKLQGDRVWVQSCQAQILAAADRWDEAAEVARAAWEAIPGMPYSAHALAVALDAVGRTEELSEILLAHIEGGGQSWEVADICLGFGARGLEQLPEGSRAATFKRLMAVCDSFLALAPLRDRSLSRAPAWHRAMLSRIVGDNAEFANHAAEIDAPYFKQIADNMARTPEGARKIIPHRSIRQRHNTCFPASIATLGTHFELDLDQDRISHELSYEGTATFRVDRWARAQGWTSRPFLADRDTVVALIDAGVPFILCLRALGAAHAVTAIGYDLSAGTLVLHDPGDGRLKELLLDRLDQGEAPFGPSCLVLLPPGEEGRLESIALNSEAAETANLRYQEAISDSGVDAAEAVAARFEKEFPGTPMARFLRGKRQAESGEPAKSLDAFLSLLSDNPECAVLQFAVLQSTASHVDTPRLRETLHNIVTRAPLPGIDGSRDWIYPAPFLYASYAELLLQSTAQFGAARRWIERALRRDPIGADGYYQLGELYALQRRPEDSLLPYRIAASLESSNEQMVITYVNVLYKLNRIDEAISYLRRRADKYSGKVSGSASRVTLIQALEFFGRPAQGLKVLEDECARRTDDGHLAGFAVEMFSRYGRLDDAHRALDSARSHAPRGVWLRAAHELAVSKGRPDKALEYAYAWLKEYPFDADARISVLRLTEARDGPDAALKLAEKWSRERPNNELLEDLLLDQLDNAADQPRIREVLKARLKRNPHDGAAWQRLAFELLSQAKGSAGDERARRIDEFRRVVDRCRNTSAGQPQTLALEAELKLLDGDREAALRNFMAALDAEPGYIHAIPRVFEISRIQPAPSRTEVFKWISRAIGRVSGHVHYAVDVADLIASEAGLEAALQQVDAWRAQSPHDPYVLEARIRIHLDHGAGTSSIMAILPEAEEGVADYPLQEGLRLALAEAYSKLFRADDAIQLLNDLLEISPRHSHARQALAMLLRDEGRFEEAESALREAVNRSPLEVGPWMLLASFLEDRQRVDEALEVLEEANRRVPSFAAPWEKRVKLLVVQGRPDTALEVAREVVRRFPQSPSSHIQLALLMLIPGAGGTPEQAEIEFQRAIEANAQDLEALAEYAEFLFNRGQADKARQLVNDRRPLFDDPVAVDLLSLRMERARNSHGALNRLDGMLDRHPEAPGAWGLFMEWVDEDQEWQRARRRLESMPELLRRNPALESLRLVQLGLGGAPQSELDRQWDELIFNFPANYEANLRRFDVLFDAGRLDDADSTLAVFGQHDDSSPPILSRNVRLCCARRQFDEAFQFAERLWLYPGADAEDASLSAVLSLFEAKRGKSVLSRILELLDRGETVQRASLQQCGQLCMELKDHRSLEKLLEVITSRADKSGDFEVIGYYLDTLVELGKSRRVLGWAKKHPGLARASASIRGAIAAAYINSNRLRESRDWLADWRTWKDADQYIAALFAQTALGLGHFGECAVAAREGLDRFAPTPASARLAQFMFYGMIAQGHWLEFCSAYDAYEGALHVEGHAALVETFACLRALIRESDPVKISHIHQSVLGIAASGRLWMPPRVVKSYNTKVKAKIGFFRRFTFVPLK